MADFFKGLTGGFQSGLQLGEAMRAKQEREALAQIMQEKPVDAGPDFAGQFRAKGLEQGPMPQAEPIQDTQSFMGQQYAQGALTPDKLTGLRYSAMADVMAQRDPAAALRMRQEATRMEREAIEAPLRTQALQQQVGLGGIQLTEAQRKAEGAGRMDAFNTELNQLQNPTPDQMKSLAAKYNLDRAQQLEVTSQYTGIAKNELDAFDLDIKKAVKGKDLTGLIDLHKNDPRFGDGTHFVMAKGDKGQVILNLVSDADPSKVLRTESFKDSTLATAYLRKAAEDPANLAEWMMGMRGKEADIKAKEASTAKDIAQAGLVPAQADYYKSRGAMDRMGAAQYFEGKDGNTYASVPVMGKQGLTFETVQVNQPGVKFNKLGGAGDGKPVEVKEEGTKVTIGGQLKVADGLGGWIDPKGVLPSERTKVLSAAKIPDNLVAQLPWNSAGTAVGFAGQAYNVRDPKDMKQLKADYERLGRTAIEVDEAQKAGLGLHSRMRSLEGRTPSPYDSPDVWSTYRAAPNR
jgi:hypothetical protein